MAKDADESAVPLTGNADRRAGERHRVGEPEVQARIAVEAEQALAKRSDFEVARLQGAWRLAGRIAPPVLHATRTQAEDRQGQLIPL